MLWRNRGWRMPACALPLMSRDSRIYAPSKDRRREVNARIYEPSRERTFAALLNGKEYSRNHGKLRRTEKNRKERKRMRRKEKRRRIEDTGSSGPPAKFTDPTRVRGTVYFSHDILRSSQLTAGSFSPLIPPFNFAILSLIYGPV